MILILALYMLVKEVGYAAFLMILVMAVNSIIQRKISKRVYQTDLERKKLMDSRSSLVEQSVIGMKNVKFNSWEDLINHKMEAIREEESVKIRKMIEYSGLQTTVLSLITPVGSLICLSIYIWLSNSPSVSSVYCFMLYLSILYGPINLFSTTVFVFGSAKVSLERINQIADLDDYEEPGDDQSLKVGEIRVNNGTFVWNDPKENKSNQRREEQEKPTISSANLKISQGETCYILGMVGSGKSSLIYSIIDNLYRLGGEVKTNGSIAIIPQEPFLLNDTLRNNILFGKEYDQDWYLEVLNLCQLESDLDILPAGDKTEIGERGINLSGGQKQRISIARAVYSQSDIYLVDDCLSALDAHIGKRILEGVFRGCLSEKTMLIATHHYQYVQPHERVILIRQGVIEEDGLLGRVSKSQAFKVFALQSEESKKEKDDADKESSDDLEKSLELKKVKKSNRKKENKNLEDVGKLIRGEDRGYGIISWGVYFFYLRKGGIFRLMFVLLAFSISAAIDLTVSWWPGKWANLEFELPHYIYFFFYLGLVILTLISMLIKYYNLASLSSKSSKIIFNELFWNILRRPMSFFDTTSSGMILNRCTDDVSILDSEVPKTMSGVSGIIFQILATLALTSYSYPLFIVFLIPSLVGCYFLIKMYLLAATELKRLNKVSVSPILTSVSELIKGSNSIRLFGYKEVILKKWEESHNQNMKVRIHEAGARSWFQLVVNFFFMINLAFVAGFMIISKLKG